MNFPPRIFSGIQPTGALHLGNYLGALKLFASLQQRYAGLYCIVDLHALTVRQDPAALAANSRHIAAAYLAAGLDPAKNIIFCQSQVSGHAELAWLFACTARLGWLNRMTQFKEKSGQDREKASAGLYIYPVLMAADILLYRATHVPIGEDQIQHLELTRDIAQRFNQQAGQAVFPLPEALHTGAGARVMSLRDGSKKMSKSDPSPQSRLVLGDSAETLKLKIRRAKTDALPLPESLDEAAARPEAFNLLTIYAALKEEDPAQACARFAGGQFSALKEELADLLIAVLTPLREEMQRLLKEKSEIDRILAQGAERARALAEPVLADAKKALGLLL